MLAAANVHVGTDLPVVVVVFAVLLWLGMIIARRVSAHDSYPKLRNVIIASVVLHLVCASMQIFVVDHLYHGVADWLRYDNQGRVFADHLRAGQFTFSGTTIGKGFVNNGSISFVGGIIMLLVGPNQLAAFMVSAWLAFVGTVFFYKAFTVTFPGVDRRFYAWLIFLFPSLLFWTADVGKESFMLFALGLTAYGMALVLARMARGYFYALIGGVIGIVIRPNELLLIVAGFAIAMIVRAFGGAELTGTTRRRRGVLGSIGAFVFVAVAVAVVALVAHKLLHPLTASKGGGLGTTLTNLNQINAGSGTTTVAYSPNPLYYPRDVYTVLFDPFWINGHGLSQLVQSVENTLIAGVIVYSFRRLRYLIRACVQRPYVLLSLVYCIIFFYVFAALGDLGLITRERTLILPFLFVLLAIPVARPSERPYPWQERRAKHKKSRLGPGPDERVPTDPVVHSMSTVQWESRLADGAQADWSRGDWGAEI